MIIEVEGIIIFLQPLGAANGRFLRPPQVHRVCHSQFKATLLLSVVYRTHVVDKHVQLLEVRKVIFGPSGHNMPGIHTRRSAELIEKSYVGAETREIS